MPSTYTHYRFGQEVLTLLPDKVKKNIETYKELFDIGLHGPDILFFYRPYVPNQVNKKGFHMHKEAGVNFFEVAGQRIYSKDKRSPYFAYIYGFICHYVLDSECHGFINDKIQEIGVSHIEIEGEFDRKLMCLDGHNPITHYLTEHIHPTARNCHIVATFFDGVTKMQIGKSLRSMKLYNNFLVAPHHMKRWIIFSLLGITGNYWEVHGLIINYKPNKKCVDSTKKLMILYENALSQAVKLISEYQDGILHKQSLDPRYRFTFSSKEIL